MQAMASDTTRLFSYGTLQQPEVQQATFGRLLDGQADAVAGFRLETLTITDPAVIATSGSAEHPVLVPTDEAGVAVSGTVFDITWDELLAADDYEVDDYARVEVPMRSGGTAWVYVFATQAPEATSMATSGD
jgi:gamma-glutamylcyclotransferase (GGCT)/AIG2-like uncharacterized protein YtfP